MRGAVGDRQRGRLLEADRARHGDELIGVNAAIFRHAAVEHFAHQAFLLAHGIDQHAVALFPLRDPAALLDDFPRHVEADDDRQRHLDPGHAAHCEHVMIIERRSAHPDHHLPCIGPRCRVVLHQLELIEPTLWLNHAPAAADALAAHLLGLLG